MFRSICFNADVGFVNALAPVPLWNVRVSDVVLEHDKSEQRLQQRIHALTMSLAEKQMQLNDMETTHSVVMSELVDTQAQLSAERAAHIAASQQWTLQEAELKSQVLCY